MAARRHRWAIVITNARIDTTGERAGQQAESRSLLSPLARRFPRFFLLLAILGPGLIAANAGNDAGGIATYAATGARYGYQLLWVIIVMTVSLIVVQEMAARLGAATGMGFTDLVREHFGVRWTAFVVVALLVANFGTAFSEFVGIGAAADLLQIPRLAAIPVAAAMLWLLIVFGSYKIVERAFLAMSLVFLAYPVAAVLAHPAWGSVAHGLLVPTTPRDPDAILLIVAIIGTTITPYMQLYLQSSLAEKSVRPEDYVYERVDAIGGAVFADFIALTIIIATAAALYTHGIRDVSTASEAARALEPVAGSLAQTLFAIGLLGACLLAAPVLALVTSYSIAEALGLEKGISRNFTDAPAFMGLFTGMIFVAALLAMLPGIPFTSTLIVIQIVDGVVLPVVIVSLLKLTNDRGLMGARVNGVTFNAIAIATAAVIISLSLILVALTLARPFLG